ncbi:hypothetical protein [Brachybacterium phenoliresistens]|uniref:hypothetical protein n=1 Tax=Brachybacterium phenoliresistens TaxID=396014 RepID=UPI0031DD4DAD
MRARRQVPQRPARPAPECEDCGAQVWWAWSLHGKCWVSLHPEAYPLEGRWGTFEVWRDVHGGLLCKHLPPGERGEMDRSFRGLHHNAKCGTWARETTAALARESEAAVPAMTDGDLAALSHRLRAVLATVEAETARRQQEA